MTITDIIANLEDSQFDIEEMTQIPESYRGNIINELNNIIDTLNECAENYGDDTEEFDDFEDKNDEEI